MKAQVILPWPSKALSPNTRVHWAELSKAKKAAKTAAFYLTKQALFFDVEAQSIKVNFTFSPPSHRAFDADNLISSHKAALDGISLAIGVDDSRFIISASPMGCVVKGGRVVVDLEWADE